MTAREKGIVIRRVLSRRSTPDKHPENSYVSAKFHIDGEDSYKRKAERSLFRMTVQIYPL